mgnify:CR=1 FL=1
MVLRLFLNNKYTEDFGDEKGTCIGCEIKDYLDADGLCDNCREADFDDNEPI